VTGGGRVMIGRFERIERVAWRGLRPQPNMPWGLVGPGLCSVSRDRLPRPAEGRSKITDRARKAAPRGGPTQDEKCLPRRQEITILHCRVIRQSGLLCGFLLGFGAAPGRANNSPAMLSRILRVILTHGVLP
jgi:hypothetical protein